MVCPLRRRSRCWCICDCGKFTFVQSAELKNGKTRSCGCLNDDRFYELITKHGHCVTDRPSPEYKASLTQDRAVPTQRTKAIKNTAAVASSFYFLRLISGLAELGPKPSPQHSVDRKNNNGHYEPGNCRWATRKQQNNNRRRVAA